MGVCTTSNTITNIISNTGIYIYIYFKVAFLVREGVKPGARTLQIPEGERQVGGMGACTTSNINTNL